MAFRVDNYCCNNTYVCIIILLLNNYVPGIHLSCSFKIVNKSHNNIENFPKSQTLQCLSQLVCTRKPLFCQTEERTAATKYNNLLIIIITSTFCYNHIIYLVVFP